MDGVEMIHQIFSLQPHTNVIVMTGYQMERMLPDDLKKLCSSISKPFTPKQLIAAILKCLKFEEALQRPI